MPLNVFISYSGHDDEQAVVWRLQTLAAAQGIQAYVPHRAAGRQYANSAPRTVPPADRAAIDQADVVLAIITSRTHQALENELSYALTRKKLIVPIVQEGVPLPPVFQRLRTFSFSPSTLPGSLETQIVEFLKERRLNQERLQAVGAIVAVGLGLLLLSAVAKE